ncbi:MAG: hypothetical protein JWM33_3897 [Caulobacteraceae bacterium]|nr:hypothetical protein [Caulobacteraceae bacterium]
MQISITRKGARNQLSLVRDDGSSDLANLGPNLPHHDLAHYVVERRLELHDGFFGHLARGYSMAQLSDDAVIRTLGAGPGVAETLARGLQAMSSGACLTDQYNDLVNAQLSQWSLPTINLSLETVEQLIAEFTDLTDRFASLGDGETLELDFPIAPSRP